MSYRCSLPSSPLKISLTQRFIGFTNAYQHHSSKQFLILISMECSNIIQSSFKQSDVRHILLQREAQIMPKTPNKWGIHLQPPPKLHLSRIEHLVKMHILANYLARGICSPFMLIMRWGCSSRSYFEWKLSIFLKTTLLVMPIGISLQTITLTFLVHHRHHFTFRISEFHSAICSLFLARISLQPITLKFSVHHPLLNYFGPSTSSYNFIPIYVYCIWQRFTFNP